MRHLYKYYIQTSAFFVQWHQWTSKDWRGSGHGLFQGFIHSPGVTGENHEDPQSGIQTRHLLSTSQNCSHLSQLAWLDIRGFYLFPFLLIYSPSRWNKWNWIFLPTVPCARYLLRTLSTGFHGDQERGLPDTRIPPPPPPVVYFPTLSLFPWQFKTTNVQASVWESSCGNFVSAPRGISCNGGRPTRRPQGKL
jgi:hypothetical protein